MINTRVAQKLKIPPEYLNCFTSIGTKVEHLWPLIEPNHPTLSEKECKRKASFTQKIQDEIVIEYTKLIKGSQICYSIDNEIVTSLNTVIEVFVDDCKLDEGYFASAQVLINVYIM
ncbi:hypothetical protein RF11_13784 [Thelohanellus kitauei]|uniref:Uncharacterized protein n=1 Tax=Thelohanellus kitauei TaxID=669202 RepID=A0A0C2MPW5_THEKT|nr:hypothetical protein RF11_13784 [Thelohanellus kitauei]